MGTRVINFTIKGVTYSRFSANWQEMKFNGKWCAGVMGVNCMHLFPTLQVAMSHWRLEICYCGSIYMWKWANKCFKLGILTFTPLPYPKSLLLWILSPHHWLEYTSHRQGFHPLSIKNIDLPNLLLIICLFILSWPSPMGTHKSSSSYRNVVLTLFC